MFRPDAIDDYSSGTFIHLLDQPGTAQTTGITLIEKDVLIGDVTLQAGTFLFTQESVDEESSIYHFSADDAGAAWGDSGLRTVNCELNCELRARCEVSANCKLRARYAMYEVVGDPSTGTIKYRGLPPSFKIIANSHYHRSSSFSSLEVHGPMLCLPWKHIAQHAYNVSTSFSC